jgi:hypothetical protein
LTSADEAISRVLTPLYPNWANRDAAVVRIRSSALPRAEPDDPLICCLAAGLEILGKRPQIREDEPSYRF